MAELVLHKKDELATTSLQETARLADRHGESPRIQASRMAHGKPNGQIRKRFIPRDRSRLGKVYEEIERRTCESWGLNC